MQASEEFIFGEATAWEDVGPGLKRQVMGYDDKIKPVKVDFQPAAVGQLHEYNHRQVTYGESEVFETTIGDEMRTIRDGEAYYVPPHLLHGCVCSEAGVLIDVFSPTGRTVWLLRPHIAPLQPEKF